MQVIEYLQKHSSDKLTSELGIKYRPYNLDGDTGIAVLNYSQIDSPKTHPIVIECRGLIIDKNTFDIICRPFDRFFNYGEAPETCEDFDITRAIAFEKIDGSLIKIYNYGGTWYAGTKGTAFAESPVNGYEMTFFDLVCSSLGVQDHKEFTQLCDSCLVNNVTYLFEVTSLENRVVKRYDDHGLWYLGARITDTGEDISCTDGALSSVKDLGCKLPEIFVFDTISHCLDAAKELTNLDEGYVLHDPVSNKRVKVKSPAYVAVHHLRGEGLNPKRVKQLVLTGEEAEYLKYFPEDRDFVDPYVDALFKFECDVIASHKQYKYIEGQKEFALSIKSLPFNSLLFQSRKFECCPWNFFGSLDENRKLKLFNAYLGE